jgi:hypothetical protein
MSKRIPWQCRQGDVFLERISDAIKAGKVIAREAGRIVLAHGEATGHAHVVENDDAVMYELEDKTSVGNGVWNRLLRALKGATLRHDCPGQAAPDHGAIPLPPGEYEVIQQLTYTPEAIRVVAD